MIVLTVDRKRNHFLDNDQYVFILLFIFATQNGGNQTITQHHDMCCDVTCKGGMNMASLRLSTSEISNLFRKDQLIYPKDRLLKAELASANPELIFNPIF